MILIVESCYNISIINCIAVRLYRDTLKYEVGGTYYVKMRERVYL